MTTVHKPRLLYDAISTQLATTGKAVGEGKRPVGAEAPYYVLRPSLTRRTLGTLTDPDHIRDQTFIVFYVGNTMDEAQQLQEKAQEALLGFSPTVTGFAPGPIELDQENLLGGPDHDGPTFEIADRFLISVD